ncbi:MAG: hypothetical protein ACRC3Y_01050 [Romboutsia sp.]|uniref:hypothetical protein n=1 Tax=Romboutsia sp. TaxID=1965302 RepID=UPI003F3773F4
MLENIENVIKIVFLILSIVWIGKIMVLRTDKQIVINPLLIGIASILAVLPQSDSDIEVFGVTIQTIRIILYCIYSLIIILGLYAISRKNGIF